MNAYKSRSLKTIEEKMEDLDQGSLRYHVLKNAKDFKTSWVELGRALYSVHKDKLYKEWGYTTFDIYTAKEIGIRKQTALKLLKSYYFLEKEEPLYLKREYAESQEASSLPSLDSIDVLRLAKNKKVLDEEDYANLKKEVFEKGKDAADLKRGLAVMIRERQEFEPEEAQRRKKVAAVRRLIGTLKALKKEVEISKLLPVSIIKEAAALIDKLEGEILQE